MTDNPDPPAYLVPPELIGLLDARADEAPESVAQLLYGYGYLAGRQQHFSVRAQWFRLAGFIAQSGFVLVAGAIWADNVGSRPVIVAGLVVGAVAAATMFFTRTTRKTIQRQLAELEERTRANE